MPRSNSEETRYLPSATKGSGIVLQHVAERCPSLCRRARGPCPRGRCGRPPSPHARRGLRPVASWSGFRSREQGWLSPMCHRLHHLLEYRAVTLSLFLPRGRGRGGRVFSLFHCRAREGFGKHSLMLAQKVSAGMGSGRALWPRRCGYRDVLSGREEGVVVPLLLQPSLALCSPPHSSPASAQSMNICPMEPCPCRDPDGSFRT